jgi:hypothetical protein
MRPAFPIQPAFTIWPRWSAALAQPRRARFRPTIGERFESADRKTGERRINSAEGLYRAPERSADAAGSRFMFIILGRHIPRVGRFCNQFTRHSECL